MKILHIYLAAAFIAVHFSSAEEIDFESRDYEVVSVNGHFGTYGTIFVGDVLRFNPSKFLEEKPRTLQFANGEGNQNPQGLSYLALSEKSFEMTKSSKRTYSDFSDYSFRSKDAHSEIRFDVISNTEMFITIEFDDIITGSIALRHVVEGETLPPNPKLKEIFSSLRTFFRRYYPEVSQRFSGELLHFEHDTRSFLVHEALKNGSWQEAREMRGPRQGGILCEVTLVDGVYRGAATVPQTFDKPYFKVLLLTSVLEKEETYLRVELAYPRDVAPEFLAEFQNVVNEAAAGFE